MLGNSKPSCIVLVWASLFGRRCRQRCYAHTYSRQLSHHMSSVLPADKTWLDAAHAQRFCESKAAADVADAYIGRGIDPKYCPQASRRPSMNASAAGTPTVTPRHLAKSSTPLRERGCGQSRSSMAYASSAASLSSIVPAMSSNQLGANAGALLGSCHSVLEGTSKQSKDRTQCPGCGRHAVTTAACTLR